MGFFGGFSAFFALLWVVPELSASFWSPRWRRVLCHRGLLHNFMLRVCYHRVRGQPVPCRFCGAPDGDGRLLWECTFPPLVEIRENPEVHDLMREDEGHWPRCLLWHGWLPMLSGVNGACPWAADASESAGYLVDVALGRYSSGLITEWSPPDWFNEVGALSLMPDHSNVWTDGSSVVDQVTGVSSSGAGLFAHQSENCWSGRRWGHVDGVRPGQVVRFPLVEVYVLFLGLCSIFRELRCGVSF